MIDDSRKENRDIRRRVFGLHGKLVLSHLAVIAVAMTLTGFGLLTLVRAYLLAALEDNLRSQAELVAASLLSEAGVQVQPPASDPAFNTLQQQQIANLAVQVQNQPPGSGANDFPLPSPESIELTSLLPTHVLVLDSAGRPVFESGSPGPAGLRVSTAAKSALAGKTGRAILRGEPDDWITLALPLVRDGRTVGALALAHPLSDLDAFLNDTLFRLIVAAGLAAALSALLGLILAGRLVRPLSQLTTAARRLGEGDYQYPMPTGSRDEIGLLSATFESMRSALQRTERTRAQFISDVSHELRTPLTGIKGLVETLQDGALEDRQARRHFVASIGHETDRMIRLTQDLLTLARADEHALALRLEQRDLGEMIADTLDRLSHEAGKRENRFVFVRPDFALPVHVDADRLEQVLLNLMDNALKNSPADGVIRVEVEKIRPEDLDTLRSLYARPGARESSTSALGQWILVRIVDQGVGIPAEARGRVFDRFYRADPARDRQRGGSGLGLSIAKALIEEHGGRIWIESPSPGWNGDGLPGTQVSFALPLSE